VVGGKAPFPRARHREVIDGHQRIHGPGEQRRSALEQ
jgi:hypothetical protein